MIKELSALEKRLDARIDFWAQSFKDYADSRFRPVNTKLDALQNGLQALVTVVRDQNGKMDRYFNGIVQMIEGLTGKTADIQAHVDNHERRIVFLEGK